MPQNPPGNPPPSPPPSPRRKRGGKASAPNLAKQEQTDAALELRRKGYSYREIAKEMGLTRRAAYKLVTDAFADVAKNNSETAEQMVRLQLMQMDAMLKALAGQIEHGNSRSIEVALRVLERQSKLLGLDAPAKQEVKVSYSELSDEELLAEAERLKIKVDVLDVSFTPLPGEKPDHLQKLLPGPTSSSPPPASPLQAEKPPEG